jgi:outer membrane protein OmpA-like peptidoglycan-associated protein
MKKTVNLISVLGAVIILTACSYFDIGEKIDVSADHPQKIDLVTGEAIEAQPLAPVEYEDVADMIRQSSDGRVQIFPLDDAPVTDAPFDGSFNDNAYDGGAIDVSPVPAVPLYAENNRNPYPGVEVYPLDDAMAAVINTPISSASADAPMTLTPFPEKEGVIPGRGGNAVAVATPGGVPAVVYFAHDSVSLNQKDLAQISELVRNYEPDAVRDISVAGHASVQSSITDPVQRKIVNLKVSMDRAFAVARALIESGVPPERIETRAYGETRPPGLSDMPIDVASRRVEIYGISVQ